MANIKGYLLLSGPLFVSPIFLQWCWYIGRNLYYVRFTDVETETQRVSVICQSHTDNNQKNPAPVLSIIY